MSGMEAMALVAGGTMVVGQMSAAQAQAQASRQSAEIKRMQAAELLSRQEINEQIMREQSERVQRGYGSAFASTGREGAGLGGIMEIRRATAENIQNSRRDAEFKAKMLRMGADIETSLASDAMTASAISMAGTLLATGVRAYNIYRGPSTPKGLPGG